MKLSKFVALLFFIVFLPLSNPIRRFSLAVPVSTEHTTKTNCLGSFDRLTQDENWFEQLIDPVFISQAQISENISLYSEIHDCLNDDPDSLPDELKIIHRLTEYFLIFAGGFDTPSEATSLYLVSFGTSDDPAIVQIRDKVGIEAPPGFVYIRTYSSREAMPALVKSIFQEPDVKGVTILTRYIAILTENRLLESQALPKTVSHELVHAYFNSVLGIDSLDLFPTWYDEGIAIYFSGSSNPSCARQYIDPVTYFNTCEVATEDYEQYDANFKYLESEWGRDRFLELVKLSFERVDPDLIYRDLGFSTYEELATSAMKWKQHHDFILNAEITGVCAFPFILYLVYGFWKGVREARDSLNREKDRSPDFRLKSRDSIPIFFSQVALNSINEFWSTLPKHIYKLGSEHRLSYVFHRKKMMEHSTSRLEHQCAYCHRWTVLYLPDDISREEYAKVFMNSHGSQLNYEIAKTVSYPYAICLYCGNIYGTDSFGNLTVTLA